MLRCEKTNVTMSLYRDRAQMLNKKKSIGSSATHFCDSHKRTARINTVGELTVLNIFKRN